MPRDYYSVLEVDRNASRADIRARFLQLARERHPDLFQGEDKAEAEEVFQGITEAFNVLFNPERRRLHDMELQSPDSGPTQGPVPEELAKVYLSRGVKAYKQRQFVQAAENFDRATQQDAKNAQAWYYLALTCSQNPRWRSRGLKAIAEACEIETMNPDYNKLAGRMFAAAGMSIRAERYYRTALQWGDPDPKVEEALQQLEKDR